MDPKQMPPTLDHRHSVRQIRNSHLSAKRRAERLLREVFNFSDEESVQRNIPRFATDRKPCSCDACGNWRRSFGVKPRQWLRLDESDRDDEDDALDEFDEGDGVWSSG